MSRIQFSTRLRRRKQFRQKTLNNVVLFLVALIPIYPAFGSYMQDYTGAIVRGQYDKNTIIDSYDDTTGQSTYDILNIVDSGSENGNSGSPQATSIPVATIPTTPPEPEKTVEIAEKPLPAPVDKKRPLYMTHTIQKGDTLSTIAQKYNLSVETLRSMNNISGTHLSVGKKLLIPRISGVEYVVQKGDTLSTIAQKYGINDSQNILIANDMSSGKVLSVGRKLLLPNPTKDPTKKIVVAPPVQPVNKPVNTSVKTTPKTTTANPKKNSPNVQKTISYGDYSLDLKVPNGCRGFAWGNCTCFVAKYKNVTWHGNAKDWLKNARKQGIPTGNTPKPGAIVVYYGPGFPPAYGHVGIVMEVDEEDMVIKDMNYRALNEVTTRRESFDNPAIIGYIYVD